jgi:hypothetical protein
VLTAGGQVLGEERRVSSDPADEVRSSSTLEAQAENVEPGYCGDSVAMLDFTCAVDHG